MDDPTIAPTQRPLFSWIFDRNRKWQLAVVTVVAVAVPVRIVPIEMQKRIVNDAILANQSDRLVLYCGIYLAAFLTAGGLKYLINILQNLIGQRTLARMRRAYFSHIVRLPFGFFRNVQSGAVVATLTTELAAAGDFIGASVAVPFTNLLTLVAFAVYLFWLNPLLAAISFSIYPVVVLSIPRLQERVNRHNRRRVGATRDLSGKIGEAVDGLYEIKTANAYACEADAFGRLADKLCRIRIRWNLYRFGVKAVNNLFVHFSRFLIFFIGGYLAMQGRIDIGGLVAFISAQERLYTPWKELIRFYQAYQNAAVTYRRTQRTYDIPAEAVAKASKKPAEPADGGISISDLDFTTPDGTRLLHDLHLDISPGQHLALVGASGSGKSTLAHCLVRLDPHTGGRIGIGGVDIAEMSRPVLARIFGFVSQRPFVFTGTINENLVYGLQTRDDGDISLEERIQAIEDAGLLHDIFELAMDATLPPDTDSAVKERIVDVRRHFAENRVTETDSMETYDGDRFVPWITVAENVLFGKALETTFAPNRLADHPIVLDALERHELVSPLEALGRGLAQCVADSFSRSKCLEEMLQNLSIGMGELRRYQGIVDRIDASGTNTALPRKDRRRLLRLALAHKPDRLPELEVPVGLKKRITTVRTKLRPVLESRYPGAVSFFDRERFIENVPLLENILYGRLGSQGKESKQSIYEEIHRLLIEKEVLNRVFEAGLQQPVGSRGENLSGGQRQKLAIARTFLKAPPIFVLDEATASLDRQSQSNIHRVLRDRWKGRCTLVSVMHRLDNIDGFDRIAVMDSGRIREIGTFSELMEREGLLHRMIRSGGDATAPPAE